ncbi:2OG-Fe(II) oxygenase [Bacteriovoracaceae bacterium]|nr:2OG-Fe(II) oxygenase [Bacteriovoracaceae bacterium]
MFLKSIFDSRTSDSFNNAVGFPHLIIENALENSFANKVLDDFSKLQPEALQLYNHFNAKVTSSIGRKYLSKNMLSLIDEMQSENFISQIQNLTGIENLIADKGLAQGGILDYPKGNFVNLHTDNLTHPFDHTLKTSLTILIYFNKDWPPSYKGDLEIWDNCATKKRLNISPKFNRMVILKAGPETIHGLPDEINSPEGMGRKALVLWYYQKANDTPFAPTKYYPRPNDPLNKKAFIYFGNFLLKCYYFQRKYLGDWDYKITKIMKLLSK